MDRGDPETRYDPAALARDDQMRSPLLLITFGLVSCVVDEPSLGASTQASTVDDHVETSCSTAVVLELSRQIAGEVGCMAPGQLVSFAEGNGIEFAGAAVLPYLSEVARADLLDAVAAGGGRPLQLTSVYRTVAQQYLLYRWYQLGRCGIAVAATPGTSNHESGRAIDVSNHAAWIADLGATGWAHDVPGDDVHFDHARSPDLRGTDVLAFQRLWNRNHASTPIDEDGAYGPMTAMALARAPAEGFAIGPSCAIAGLAAEVERVDAPRTLATGARAHVAITLRNTGTLPWPAGTALVTGEPLGRASALADASWPSPARAALLDAAVAVGATGVFELDVLAPVLTADTELSETFTLAAGAEHFGAVALVVTVTTGGGTAAGGCDAGGGDGGAGALGLGLLALVTTRGRRSRAVASAGRR